MLLKINKIFRVEKLESLNNLSKKNLEGSSEARKLSTNRWSARVLVFYSNLQSWTHVWVRNLFVMILSDELDHSSLLSRPAEF